MSRQERKCKCAYCEKVLVGPQKRCGNCKVPYYCDRECQKKHWKTHRASCLATSKSLPPEHNMAPYFGPKARSKEWRDMQAQIIHQMVLAKHGNVPHCAICGDTNEECELKRVPALGRILCNDCIRIQQNI